MIMVVGNEAAGYLNFEIKIAILYASRLHASCYSFLLSCYGSGMVLWLYPQKKLVPVKRFGKQFSDRPWAAAMESAFESFFAGRLQGYLRQLCLYAYTCHLVEFFYSA